MLGVCECVCERKGGVCGGGGGWRGGGRGDGLAAGCDKSYPERLFILVLLLELKQECWSQLKPNT